MYDSGFAVQPITFLVSLPPGRGGYGYFSVPAGFSSILHRTGATAFLRPVSMTNPLFHGRSKLDSDSSFNHLSVDLDIHRRMTDNDHTLTRRQVVKRGAGAIGLTAVAPLAPLMLTGCDRPPPEPEHVKVGILHSQTGTMAISEISLVDMEIMAIEEINAGGGLLGELTKQVLIR